MRALPLLLCAVATTALVACDRPIVEPTPPGPLTPDSRMAAISAVEDRYSELLRQGLAPAAIAEALAASLRQRPEFAAVGLDETLNVWAEFTDGRLLIVSNNVIPTDDEPAPALAARPPEAESQARAWSASTSLPTPATARILHTFGGEPAVQNTVNQLRAWFGDASVGYTVRPAPPGDSAGVESLRTVSGDGFLYLNAHGGRAVTRAGDSIYSIQSATRVTPALDSLYGKDLDSARLAYHTEKNGLPNGATDTRYGITQHFVTRYMGFGANSVVFLNVCWSTNAAAEPRALVAALHAKGARAVLGWSRNVRASHGLTAARYFADRVLGANRFKPESVPQRPFDVEQVLQDMGNKRLATDDSTGAQLLLRRNPAGGPDAAILRPSIARLAFDSTLTTNYGSLVVHGSFGPDPRPEGSVVMVGGGREVPLMVLAWTPDSIRVLPKREASEAGFAGDVVVVSRGRRSNPRRLMAWNGNLLYTWRPAGSITVRIQLGLVVRFDPDRVRTVPGMTPMAGLEQPTRSQFHFAEAHWDASGSAPATDQDGNPCTLTASGSGTVRSNQSVATAHYSHRGDFDPLARTLSIAHLVVVRPGAALSGCGEVVYLAVDFGTGFISGPGNPLVMGMDGAWRLVGDRRTGVHASYALEWPSIAPFPAYDPDQPK
jgi:hypothetical protein